ncbi:MAG: radical SAM protein [Chloroflexi bacterium]|nr:radical SAM protein [Chloroflexota bacterium]
MELEFQEYRVRKIVNVHRHVDGPRFWTKYSAHPYVGCRSGCEFCYLRGGRYLGKRDPNTFDTQIQVKTNAVESLGRELAHLPPDVITCGDWQQPAEDRFRLSRGMLGVVRELGFPLFVIERSPLVTRDLDLLVDINRRAWVGVVFSLSHVDPALKQIFEPRSPGTKRRLQAMEQIAQAGILVGAALMPILPGIGDDDQHLDEALRAIHEHGAKFVLAGGLTMAGVQAERTLAAARRLDPRLETGWREFYQWAENGKPNYGPSRAYAARLGLRVRELGARHGLLDRMPRYIAPGPLAVNKRVAEQLFLKTYELELDQAHDQRIWAFRKAAWTVDESQDSVARLYAARGEAGLRELPGIGMTIAAEIARWLRDYGENG